MTESGRSEPRMSMLLFQIYQRARDRFRAGDLLLNVEKRPECLVPSVWQGPGSDCAKSGASRALAVSCDCESPNRGKQGGRVPWNTVARARALGCDAEVSPTTQGERGGYEVVGLLQLLILGWRIDKSSLSYSLWAVMTDCACPLRSSC